MIRTHHVSGLEACLGRRLRLMVGVVVRRERSDEQRLLRLRIGIVRPSSASRRGRRRWRLLVEVAGGRARSGGSSAPAASGPAGGPSRRQLVAVVVVDAARRGLLAVVVTQVVHEAALLQPLLHHLVHEAVVADESSLVLALVGARRPRTLEGFTAGRKVLAESLAVVAIGEVAKEHVAPSEIALAQRTALSIAVRRLVLLDEGNSIELQKLKNHRVSKITYASIRLMKQTTCKYLKHEVMRSMEFLNFIPV